MKYALEHKKNINGEKWLVMDTTNPFSIDNPLHCSFVGRVVAECTSKEDGELVVNSLNKSQKQK